jgi:hypothetical protein
MLMPGDHQDGSERDSWLLRVIAFLVVATVLAAGPVAGVALLVAFAWPSP